MPLLPLQEPGLMGWSAGYACRELLLRCVVISLPCACDPTAGTQWTHGSLGRQCTLALLHAVLIQPDHAVVIIMPSMSSAVLWWDTCSSGGE